MIAKYTISIKSNCPVDGGPDIYEAEITSSYPIAVEKIVECVSKFCDQKMFQEELTDLLARTLSASVRTVGWHSGVRVEVVA